MGKRYPALNGRQVDKCLRDLNCELIRQTGSHRHYTNPYRPEQLITFAYHTGDIPRGVIEDIIEDLGFTKEQFYDFDYKPLKERKLKLTALLTYPPGPPFPPPEAAA